jgi:AraC family transcriptional regulator of adaptative response/methylated-DNA-[protein]-cysteine methyltransferase
MDRQPVTFGSDADALCDERVYRRMAAAIRYIDQHFLERPGIEAVAASVGSSPAHFTRQFTRWVGINPSVYLNRLALVAAKRALRARQSVLLAACEAGLSGGGRLHDLFVNFEAVTPGQFRAQGAGVELRFGVAATPFGRALLAGTVRGLCHLAFIDAATDDGLAELRTRWPRAALSADPGWAGDTARAVFEATPAGRLRLHVVGTNFRVRVWEALLAATRDGVTTYRELAERVGAQGASRAVGGAIGGNPLAWVIPCHRVLRADGALSGYRWGVERKRAMLAREWARGAPEE